MPRIARSNQVPVFLASQFYAPIITEIFEDIVDSVTNSSESSSETDIDLHAIDAPGVTGLPDYSSSTTSTSSSSDFSLSVNSSSRSSESSSFNYDSEISEEEIEGTGFKVEDHHRALLQAIERVYATRYWVSRQPIIRTSATFDNRLHRRHEYPQLFRNSACMNPDTFDALVERLEIEEVFQNQSNYSQRSRIWNCGYRHTTGNHSCF